MLVHYRRVLVLEQTMSDAAVVSVVAAVLAVVRRGDRLLIARRANPPDLGLWGYPGGRVEPGETLAEAALRELMEETGVVAVAERLLSPLEIIRPGPPLLHVILCPVVCTWQAGDGMPMDGELAELRWATLGELVAMDAGGMSRDVVSVAREVHE